MKAKKVKKGMLQKDPIEREKMMPLHGWITPEGEFHQVHPDQAHMDYVKDYEAKNPGTKGGEINGWIRLGSGGAPSVIGMSHIVCDPNHPAVKEFSRRVKESHPDIKNFQVMTEAEPEPYSVTRNDAIAGRLGNPAQVSLIKAMDGEIANAKRVLMKLLNHPKIEFLNVAAKKWANDQLKYLDSKNPLSDVADSQLFYIEHKARLLMSRADKWQIEQDTNMILQNRGAYLDEIPIHQIVYMKEERNQIRSSRLDYQIKNIDRAPPIVVHLIDLGKEEGNLVYPVDLDPGQPLYFLENGHHRLMAAKALNRETMKAVVCPVDKRVSTMPVAKKIDEEKASKMPPGLIAPCGDFYPCKPWDHDVAAVQIANKVYSQKFYNYSGNDEALNMLYHNGWLAVGLDGDFNVAGESVYLMFSKHPATMMAMSMFRNRPIEGAIDVVVVDRDEVRSVPQESLDGAFMKSVRSGADPLRKALLVLRSNKTLKVIESEGNTMLVGRRGDLETPPVLFEVDPDCKMTAKCLIQKVKEVVLSKSHPMPVSPKLLGPDMVPYAHGKRAEEGVVRIDSNKVFGGEWDRVRDTDRRIQARKLVNKFKITEARNANVSSGADMLGEVGGKKHGLNIRNSEDVSNWTAYSDVNSHESTNTHEAFHGYMNDIEAKFGPEGRQKYIDHLHSHFHQDDMDVLEYALHTSGVQDPVIKEESVAHSINIMNDPTWRANFKLFGESHGIGFDMDRFKSSYKKMLQGAQKIGPEFFEKTQKSFKDNDIEWIMKSLTTNNQSDE